VQNILKDLQSLNADLDRSGAMTFWLDYSHSVPVWERIFSLGFAGLLKEKGLDVDFQEYLLTCFQEEIHEIVDPYDKVIFVLSHHYMLAHGFGDEREGHCASTTWASHLVDRSKTIFVNYGLQYIAEDYHPRAHTFINMNQSISEDSIKVAAECICGEKEFTGKARINLTKRYKEIR
jgi:hypothetical protein